MELVLLAIMLCGVLCLSIKVYDTIEQRKIDRKFENMRLRYDELEAKRMRGK